MPAKGRGVSPRRPPSQRRRAVDRVLSRPAGASRVDRDRPLSDLPGQRGGRLPRPRRSGPRATSGGWGLASVLRRRRRAPRVEVDRKDEVDDALRALSRPRREDPLPARGGSGRTGLLGVLRVRPRRNPDRGVQLGERRGRSEGRPQCRSPRGTGCAFAPRRRQSAASATANTIAATTWLRRSGPSSCAGSTRSPSTKKRPSEYSAR